MGVMGMLSMQNDINLETANSEYSQTPLLRATRNGHEGVVRKPLLDANLSKVDSPSTITWLLGKSMSQWQRGCNRLSASPPSRPSYLNLLPKGPLRLISEDKTGHPYFYQPDVPPNKGTNLARHNPPPPP